MQNPFEGRSLVWVSLDAKGVFTAATLAMIKAHYDEPPANVGSQEVITARLSKFDSWENLQSVCAGQGDFRSIGLVTLVIADLSDVTNAAKFLWRLRGMASHPVAVCYLEAELQESIGVLLEAGAQIVVSQLPSWQRALPRALAKVALCEQGFHPLTRGLVERLPWSQ